ncbi:MAG: GNAT family N-acetyltransferase [Pseudomonadota bacterium]
MFDFAPPPPEMPVPLQQSALFNLALMRLGVDLSHHALPGGAATVLVRRVRGLGPTGVVNRGPVWNSHGDRFRVDGLAGMRRALALRHLVINPEDVEDEATLRAAGFVQVSKPNDVAIIQLAGGPEAWLRRMRPNWRARLNHAGGQGLVAERHDFAPQGGHWIFERDGEASRQMRQHRALPHQLLSEMARLEPGAVQLFLARKGQETLAAMLFLRHGPMASYQIGWTTKEGQRLSAHHLLMWEAMQALSARGHKVLDMGVLASRRGAEIDLFKLGAGAEMRRLGGSWLDSAWSGPIHAILRRIHGQV